MISKGVDSGCFIIIIIGLSTTDCYNLWPLSKFYLMVVGIKINFISMSLTNLTWLILTCIRKIRLRIFQIYRRTNRPALKLKSLTLSLASAAHFAHSTVLTNAKHDACQVPSSTLHWNCYADAFLGIPTRPILNQTIYFSLLKSILSAQPHLLKPIGFALQQDKHLNSSNN